MAKSSEPKLEQLSVNISMGGKISIIKYDQSSDWFISMSRTYRIPEDWTNEESEEFQAAELERMREEIDALDTKEFEERFEQSFLSK